MREVYGGARVVTIVTRDLARSREFWVGGLGFAVAREEPGRSFTANLGTIRLCVESACDARPWRGAGVSLTFRVRSVARTARELEARGVPYEVNVGPRAGDWVETADPDGHHVVFVERL
jgi:catechol 2,3-dioxygenase-like lactoylglutathione lyase family enzyme